MSQSQPQQIMMLFSIGPVQEFIAQARRTRDLWFGSHLLSELSWAGARAFQTYGGTVVYPVLPSQDKNSSNEQQGSAPNRILGIIGEEVDPREVAYQVRYAMSGVWMEYVKQAYAQVKGYINQGTWDRQVSDLIEYYAVWRHYDAEAGQYASTLQAVEHDMVARKTLRDFKQNNPGALYGEVKSSMDGGRESVWLQPRDDAEKQRQQQRLLQWGIKANEQLDAISVVKRIKTSQSFTQSFPSVCEMAFLPFEKRLKDGSYEHQLVHDYYNRVREYIRDKCTDTSIANESLHAVFFYARRVEEYIDEYTTGTLEEKRQWTEQITTWLNTLYTSVPKPTPYYAFLIADGDRMGQWLRRIQNEKEHITFSKELSQFSTQAGKIVNDNEGTLVYGGGDDVMAYLPVHRCLEVADQLRAAFAQSLTPPTNAQSATLSVGIAIVHMLEPLEEVRQWAKVAEKHAKNQRNSLAIHVHKRGGGDQLNMSLSFEQHPVRHLKRWLNDFRQGYFSVQLAYELRHLYMTYEQMYKQSTWLHEKSTLPSLLKDEITRLAVKKKPTSISIEEFRSQFLTPLIELFENNIGTVDPAADSLSQLQQITEQLILTIQLEEVSTFYEEAHPSPTA